MTEKLKPTRHFMCQWCADATSVLKKEKWSTEKHICEWCGKKAFGSYVDNQPDGELIILPKEGIKLMPRLLTIETCAECLHACGCISGFAIMSLESAKGYVDVTPNASFQFYCGKLKKIIAVDPFEAIPDDCPLPKVKG